MMGVLEIAASYGPKSALVLDKPAQQHGSEAADRLVIMSAEQCSDLDQETARIRASGRGLRLQKEDHGKAAVQVNYGAAVFPQKGMYTPGTMFPNRRFPVGFSNKRWIWLPVSSSTSGRLFCAGDRQRPSLSVSRYHNCRT